MTKYSDYSNISAKSIFNSTRTQKSIKGRLLKYFKTLVYTMDDETAANKLHTHF